MSGIISDNLAKSSGLIKSAAVSQDFVKLVETSCSNASDLSIDGYFTSDYSTYLYVFEGMNCQGGAGDVEIWFNRSGTDETGSNYDCQMARAYSGSSLSASAPSGSAAPYRHMYLGDDANSTRAKQGNNMQVWLYDPLCSGTTNRKVGYTFTGLSGGGGTDGVYAWYGSGLITDDSTAISGIVIGTDSQNINVNSAKLYGLK